MEQAILTKEQQAAIARIRLNNEITSLFYLTGGTALAGFYLYHRYSDDLDFFTEIDPCPQLVIERLITDIKTSLNCHQVAHRRIYDRRLYFFALPDGKELKIEFTHYPHKRLHESELKNGIAVDSLEDIAANKIMALLDRIESKDFVDLYFLMQEKGITLDALRQLVEQKFGITLEPITFGSEFAKVRAISALPQMVKPVTLEELKAFFTNRARELSPQIFRG